MSEERIRDLLSLADPALDNDLLVFGTELALQLPACSSATLAHIESQVNEAMEGIAAELGFALPREFRSQITDLGLFLETNDAVLLLARRTRPSLN